MNSPANRTVKQKSPVGRIPIKKTRDSLPAISKEEGLQNALTQGLKIKKFLSPVTNDSVDIKDDFTNYGKVQSKSVMKNTSYVNVFTDENI